MSRLLSIVATVGMFSINKVLNESVFRMSSMEAFLNAFAVVVICLLVMIYCQMLEADDE